MFSAIKSRLAGNGEAKEPAKEAVEAQAGQADDSKAQPVGGGAVELKALDPAAEQQLTAAGVDLISCSAW